MGNKDEPDRYMAERIRKMEGLRAKGKNPFPYHFDVSRNLYGVKQMNNSLEAGKRGTDNVRVAGRIMAMRSMGKGTFVDIQDHTGKMQLYLDMQKIPDAYALLDFLDRGDFIGAQGNVFRTKRGELTVDVDDCQVLCKSLSPLPEKYHGLQDTNLRYRNRHLDLIMNPEVKGVFEQRTASIRSLRRFLEQREFVEVETPVLQPVYGGASARPFTTHINALNKDYFLQISPELYLKRLIIGGFDAVFTICKNFRNEGIDKMHNPEFTMMECYKAYVDYEEMMRLTEQMVAAICTEVRGTTVLDYQGTQLDFTPPWPRIKLLDMVKDTAGIDAGSLGKEELRESMRSHGYEGEEYDDKSWGELVLDLFEHYCEENLRQPVFIIDHPLESTPLCKGHRDDPRLIERFEAYVYGAELANAYSELNDPIVQRELFRQQAEKRKKGDEEAHQYDEDFCRALECGMPPTGGLGIGIDRLVMYLTDSPTIKDVILWPFMKAEKEAKKE